MNYSKGRSIGLFVTPIQPIPPPWWHGHCVVCLKRLKLGDQEKCSRCCIIAKTQWQRDLGTLFYIALVLGFALFLKVNLAIL